MALYCGSVLDNGSDCCRLCIVLPAIVLQRKCSCGWTSEFRQTRVGGRKWFRVTQKSAKRLAMNSNFEQKTPPTTCSTVSITSIAKAGTHRMKTGCFFVPMSVRRLQSKGILVQVFPLHEKEELKRLSFSWYGKVKLSLQPLGKLKMHRFSVIV